MVLLVLLALLDFLDLLVILVILVLMDPQGQLENRAYLVLQIIQGRLV
jgi:hypothetical protein